MHDTLQKILSTETMKELTPMLPPGRYSLTQVLEEVVSLARFEPLRLDMRDWTSALWGERFSVSQLPKCGTVLCAAGWGNMLVDGASGTATVFLGRFRTATGERMSLELYTALNTIFMNADGGCTKAQSLEQVEWLAGEVEHVHRAYKEEMDTLFVAVTA
jgi:hypothetical protein